MATDYEGKDILLGKCDRSAFDLEPFRDWFQASYMEYTIDSSLLDSVKSEMNMLDEIKIFLGTWCSDSRREVPHFFKILDYLGFPESRLFMVSLNNNPEKRKQSPGGEEKGMNIEFVPTFIFYRNSGELGRIIESPEMTLEKDLERILSMLKERPK